MLAKPLKVADGRRVIKTLNTGSRSAAVESEPDGGTALTKRRQGSGQAAGRLAPSLRLIQPRKQGDVEADPVTLRGRQHRRARHGEREPVPPGSSIKIVA